jgi:hypothetical protein
VFQNQKFLHDEKSRAIINNQTLEKLNIIEEIYYGWGDLFSPTCTK